MTLSNSSSDTQRLQVSMRTTLGVLLWFAVVFGIARVAGFFVAGGCGVAILGLAWAVLSQRRHLWGVVRSLVGLLSLGVIWFLAIDLTQTIFDCHECGLNRDVAHIRVFCVPVKTYVGEQPSALQLILSDLGYPCQHEKRKPWQKVRLWGLLVCASPCHQGIIGLANEPERYTEDISDNVRRIARDDPEMAKELSDLIFVHEDYPKFWRMIDDLTGLPTDFGSDTE